MGAHMDAGHWATGSLLGLTLLLLLAIAVGALVAYALNQGSRDRPRRDRDDAVGLLRRRLAAGEIDDKEYVALRRVLEER